MGPYIDQGLQEVWVQSCLLLSSVLQWFQSVKQGNQRIVTDEHKCGQQLHSMANDN